MGDQGERLATRREVADYLGIPIKTMTNWANRKMGPNYIKVGRLVRYDWADVDAWVEAQKRPADPDCSPS